MALGKPDVADVLSLNGVSRVFFQSLCVVAVNVFVMISGWFGIKASLKGFCNFMWQVIFIVGLSFLIQAIVFNSTITINDLMKCIGLYNGGGWFVASYIGLYILSPILNSFLSSASNRTIGMTLLGFFAFEFIWGNTLSVGFVIGGYSTFSFIGIYILSGWLRRLNLKYNSIQYLIAFFGATVLDTCLYLISERLGIVVIRDMILNYINPIVILGAASLILLFNRIHTSSHQHYVLHRTIMLLSSSSFAVYLLHVGTNDAKLLFCDGARYIYNNSSGAITVMGLLAYMVCVFMIAVIVDQPRKLIWKKIFVKLFNRKNV